MRSVLLATILVTTSAISAAGQPTPKLPACSADQTGAVLVTTIEYRDGYRVDAPWRVTSEGKFSKGGTRITVALDRIIETQPATGKRKVISLPGVVEMTFKGANQQQLLRQAADVWCATVDKAMADHGSRSMSRVAQNRTVM